MCRWLIQNRGFPVDQISEGPLAFFIFGVTIVVVAVPEGLPLAVTISLAYRCVPAFSSSASSTDLACQWEATESFCTSPEHNEDEEGHSGDVKV